MLVFFSICFYWSALSHVNAATSSKVGELMKDHLRQMSPLPKEPLPDEGLEFFDSGSESDDSGLENLVWSQSGTFKRVTKCFSKNNMHRMLQQGKCDLKSCRWITPVATVHFMTCRQPLLFHFKGIATCLLLLICTEKTLSQKRVETCPNVTLQT